MKEPAHSTMLHFIKTTTKAQMSPEVQPPAPELSFKGVPKCPELMTGPGSSLKHSGVWIIKPQTIV